MKQFLINNEEVTEQEFYERLEDANRQNVEENFDDLLDECYPEYKIGTLTVSASKIAHLDDCWYNEAINEQEDCNLSDLKYELEWQGCCNVNGYDFVIVDVDEN